MELGGPLKDTKLHAYIPGPGRYDSNKSMLDSRTSSLRAKLPDTTTKHLLKVSFILMKNPGPGAYQAEEMGKNMYYATSKFKNNTNHKISPGSRLSQIARRSTIDVSPASYETNPDELSKDGKYHLANHENSKARVFDKSARPQLVYRHMVNTPSPGQ